MGIPVIWRDIPGYTGLYQVSNCGRVKSLFRYKKELKPNISRNGYASVELFKNNQSKRLLIHRLVALAFLENPCNLPQVNHIDENKLNNHVNNLEWVNSKQNMNYGTRIERQVLNTDYSIDKRKNIAIINGKIACKPILQVLNGKVLNKFDSGRQASNVTGIGTSKISDVLNGRRKTAGGYVWIYDSDRGSDLLGSQL